MRILLLLILALGLGCKESPSPVITIMTFNIHHGEGLDGKLDLERIAAVINEADADLVALQEVDSVCHRSDQIDQAAVLASLTGMKAYYGMAFSFDGGRYGNAVLSRLPITKQQVIPLPGEPRSLLQLEVETGEGSFTFLATHLDTEEEPRRESLGKMGTWVGPAILAGDLNALRGSMTMEQLGKDWQIAGPVLPTFPADSPFIQIDYLLFQPASSWQVLETSIPTDSLSSDHRPLVSSLGFHPR